MCPVLHSFLGKGKLRSYYKIRLLEQEYILKIVAFTKQKNMVWQLKHKFIIPNLEGPFPCCRPKILFQDKMRLGPLVLHSQIGALYKPLITVEYGALVDW